MEVERLSKHHTMANRAEEDWKAIQKWIEQTTEYSRAESLDSIRQQEGQREFEFVATNESTEDFRKYLLQE